MAVFALVDEEGGGLRADLRTRDPRVRGIVELGAASRQYDPVAFAEMETSCVNGASASASEPRYISPSP